MVNTAFIKIWNQLVGAVAWDNNSGVASFEYDSGFLKTSLELSPVKMPLGKQIFTFPEHRGSATFRGLPGLLADALPDKYGNELVNIWLAQNGRSPDSFNPVELLCFIGKRAMGALEFEPAVMTETKSISIELSGLIEATKELLSHKENQNVHTQKQMADVMLDVLKMGTSAGGARPKAIIAYNESTGAIKSGQTFTEKGFDHWIIKFDGVNDTQFGDTYGYGRVEMAYYQMAIDSGIDMMESRLIEESGRAHFMTKRFDRKENNEKMHTQTFCALQHFDFNQVNSYSYEQLFQLMRILRLSYADAEQLFRRMVFNVLSRNCDDHTKNFSFLMNKEGKWKLAPAYDICHAYRPDSIWVSQHALSINGKRNGFSESDFLQVAKQNSIRFPKRVIEEIKDHVNNWSEYAKNNGVNKELSEAIKQTLNVME